MAMTPMQYVDSFLDSTALLNEPDALRLRAHEMGYLFFPGLLSVESIQPVRQQEGLWLWSQ